MTDENLDQITHSLKSMEFDNEEASKYFINYISDDAYDLNGNIDQQNQMENDSNGVDASSISNSLIITSVPNELFTNQDMKNEFEQLFLTYDPQITILYLRFFQRVRITFSKPHNALQARVHFHEYPFHGTIIKAYFACPITVHGVHTEGHLRPPEPEKLYLISPPASPPSEWNQKIENPPTVDLNLLAALAQLKPNESHELVRKEHGSNAPSIIIHTCDDANDVEINESLRKKLIMPNRVQTKRPPHSQNHEQI